MKRWTIATVTLAAMLSAAATRAADPWADHVVSYAPGTGMTNDFVSGAPHNDPLAALGQPTRIVNFDGVPTPENPFNVPTAATPFNAPFRSYEITTIGTGGSLVLSFDEPVVNDPFNPFGVDLLIFGNSFFSGSFGFPFDPNGTISGLEVGGGMIALSANGVDYLDVAGEADGNFPSNAYADAVDGYGSTAGTIPADFTLPVDPSFNPIGKTFAQLLVGYNGSGGGVGIDISPTGLSSISYVRIMNPAGSGQIPQIDAVVDVRVVPEPAALQIIFASALILLGKTARRGNVNAAT